MSRGAHVARHSHSRHAAHGRGLQGKLVLVTTAMVMVMIADDGKADAEYCGGSGGWRHGVLLGASIPSTRNLLVGPCISGH